MGHYPGKNGGECLENWGSAAVLALLAGRESEYVRVEVMSLTASIHQLNTKDDMRRFAPTSQHLFVGDRTAF